MIFCVIEGCANRVRSSNKNGGYCRDHRSRSPVVRAYQAARDRSNRAEWRRGRTLAGHGVTEDQFDAMFAEQDGRCAICGRIPDETLHIDHDHETGAPRQLLCGSCNRGIGLLGDDPGILRAAAEYLDKHHALRDQEV